MAEAHVGPLQHRHHGGPEKASTLMKGQFELDFPDSSADNRPAMQETGKIRWRRDRLPTPEFLGFPGGSAGKGSACNVGDLGLIPGLR